MGNKIQIKIPEKEITEFCKKNHIKKLSFFGSVTRDNFPSDSDIDVLVEFEPGHCPGYISFAGMGHEISDIFGGRKVDIRTPMELSKYFRDEVLSEAVLQYGQE